MPKNKKSYMNSKNILDEGLFDNLIRSLIPKSIQRKVSKKAMDVIKKDNEKLEKQIEYWKVMQKQAQERVLFYSWSGSGARCRVFATYC